MTDIPTSAATALRKEGEQALADGNIEAARTTFQSIAEAHPQDFHALAGLARCAQRSSQWSEAAELWKAVRDTAPPEKHNSNWDMNIIDALTKADRRKEARREIETYWERTPQQRRYWEVVSNVADGSAAKIRFDHVLIVSYGRSGSTILQGVLNSINGLLIRGENGNIFYEFFGLLRNVDRLQRYSRSGFSPSFAWFGITELTYSRLIHDLRPMARQWLLGDQADNPAVTAVGFKEVRYMDFSLEEGSSTPKDELVDYLAFLEELFPNAAFVFNTRDPGEVAKSGWWADEDPSTVIAEIAELEALFSEFAVDRSNCFQIDYADVVKKGAALQNLFVFLGAEFDEQRIDAVLEVPHSYHRVQPPEHDSRPRGI
jgi:hypothetical protein